MTSFAPEIVSAHTTHARRGGPANAFRYGVDYVLIDPLTDTGPGLFSRNRFNLTAVHDRDHGGSQLQGHVWALGILNTRGLTDCHLLLLTQPRCLGYVFNPVSFWLAFCDNDLCAVIAEVNNTYGDRHSYVCANPGFVPIRPDQQIVATKLMHVSPFQDVAGSYAFKFDIRPDKIAIRINFRNRDMGLIATLHGHRSPLTNRSIVSALLRRPFGAARVSMLIHWQALKLKLKGATFQRRPTPPEHEVI